MGFEQLNEALTDNAGSAKNSDGYFLVFHCCLRKTVYITFLARPSGTGGSTEVYNTAFPRC